MPKSPSSPPVPLHPTREPVDPQIAELLARRWSGQASEVDEQRIAAWLADDTTRRHVVSLLERTWNAAGQESPDTFDGIDRIDVHDRVLHRIRGAGGSRADAIHDSSSDTGVSPRPAPALVGAIRRVVIATAVAVLAITMVQYSGLRTFMDQVLQSSGASVASSPVSHEYITQRGEHAAIELADGTRVVLGPDSRLQYADVARGPHRAVTLQGIAHFSVTHDPARPFTVYANNATVQELGTAFTVVAIPEDTTVRVVVADGRVALRDHTSASAGGTVLVRADAATLNAAGFVTVRREVDLSEELSWTQRRLVFRAAQVRDVVQVLERWYDLEIDIHDSTMLSQRITVEFSQQAPDEVLAQLARVLDVTFTRSNRIVRLG